MFGHSNHLNWLNHFDIMQYKKIKNQPNSI